MYAQAQAELDVLRKTQEDLNKGKGKLEGMTQRLDAEIVQVQSNIDQLKAKDEEIDEAISKLDEQVFRCGFVRRRYMFRRPQTNGQSVLRTKPI